MLSFSFEHNDERITMTQIVRPLFASLTGQPLVARFLSAALDNQQVSHAYLFVGPVGAGKNEAARTLAKALVCENEGCGSCDDCIRAQRGTHPDVKVIDPEGVNGYVVDQMHELIHDTNFAPIRAHHKVYIITRADLLSGAAANAFLKTLEEPPARVTFILLARTRESVMATIASRCQIIAFRYIPEVEAVQLLVEENRTTEKDARIALAAAGGSIFRAREFLVSQTRRAARLKVLEIIEHLPESDPVDILDAARDLLVSLKQPLDEVRIEQERQLAEGKDFLTKGAKTALEQRQKRSLSTRERETLVEALNVLRSWLRDCLLVQVGRTDDLVNADFHYNITKLAESSTEAVIVQALAAVDEAQERIHYNVSVQLVIESLLLTLRSTIVRQCMPKG
jgi:DNA polymerase-3 subunit delta'